MRATSLPALVTLVAAAAGCAGVGEALFGSCLAVTLQVGAQVCVDAVCAAACDDDDPPTVVEDEPRPEVPPADVDVDVDVDAAAAAVACRLQLDDGSALRLGCVDGTSALALGEASAARSFDGSGLRTVEGDVVVDDAADVAGLASVFAITGSLSVQSPLLLRVRLPSLRRVGGDIVIAHNPRLVRLELPALVDVGGRVVISSNAALSADPLPALQRADLVDVVDNDALPTVVVDRLLALPRR